MPTINQLPSIDEVSGGNQIPTYYAGGGDARKMSVNLLQEYMQENLNFPDNASEVTYNPAGTSAVARTVESKLRDVVSVKDFGAVGNGVADDTAAIQAAIASLSQQVASGSAVTMGTRGTLVFPKGVYIISSPISLEPYIDIEGNRSVLKAATDTFAILDSVQYMTTISKMQFLGGTYGLYIETNNIDSTTINVNNCEFQQQVTASIATDTNSASTILNITSSKFYNTNTAAKILLLQSVDLCNFDNNWVEASCYDVFVVGTASIFAQLSVTGMMGVPLTGGSNQCWFKNYAKIKVSHSRFGGEYGGAVLVKNYATTQYQGAIDPTSVVIRDNEIFAANPTNVVMFYRLPNIFIFEGNNGLYDTKGLWFDSNANLDIFNYSPINTVFSVKNNAANTLIWKGVMYSGLRTLLNVEQSRQFLDENIAYSSVALQIPINTTSYGATSVSSGVSVAGAVDLFGNPSYYITSNGTAGDSNYWYLSMPSALSGFVSDLPYTMEIPVEITGINPFTITLLACGQQQRFNLPPGRHILSMPFVYHATLATNPNTINISIYEFWTTGAFINVSGIRFFQGIRKTNSSNTIVYNNAAPSAGYWGKGDRCIQSAPTVGQPKSWVCTAEGTPGTWVSEGNL